MKVKVNTKICENLLWEDLDYGDVCEFTDSEKNNFIGMKVLSTSAEEFLLDFELAELYSDVKDYIIVRRIDNATIIDANLPEGVNN